jgi:hypothetical protein
MIRSILRALVALTLLLGWPAAGAFAAGTPALTVVSPASGSKVTSTDITVQVNVSNFQLDCLGYGRPDQPGTGHIHALIDGTSLANLTGFYCTPTFTIPGEGLQPGTHQLLVDLATNTHADLPTTVNQISFDYEPSTAPPVPVPTGGTPTVRLTGLDNGATIGPRLHITMVTTNLQPALGLEGKPVVSGWGHYHVWIDMPPTGSSGGMSSLAGLIAMPGTNDISLDLSEWPSGKHTLTVETAQNDHTPYPGVASISLTFTLNNPAMPAAVAGATASSAMPAAMPKSGGVPDALPASLVASALLVGAGLWLKRKA